MVHRLAGSKKAHEACRLVESLYDRGLRIVLWVGDDGRAGILDQYLWTFSQSAFLPHVVWDGGPCDDPIVILTGSVANPNRADALVVVGRLADATGAEAFGEVHDLDAGGDEDAGKAAGWEAAGFAVEVVGGRR